MKPQIEHILLIDDDRDDRFFFATALAEVNPDIKITTAAEGGEAFERLKAERPDMILVDLVMPGINGIEFLRKIKRNKKLASIPVVLYTSDLSIFEERDVISLGAERVLIKANDYSGTIENIVNLLSTTWLRQSA